MTDPEAIEAARRALGKQLATCRQAADYTQATLAGEVSYTRSTIANVETGRQHVGLDFWQRCDTTLGTGGKLAAAADEVEEMIRCDEPDG